MIYLALALLGHLPAFRSLSTTTQCACQDAPTTDWFLAWTPWALSRGQSPWYTFHLLVPDGVNLTWNTMMPLPAVLAWPITATLGPLAAGTLLAVAAFAGSATAMWWVVGRWAPWGGARFAAGLLYGFSPYVVAQGTGHLNLTLVMLPPIVLLLLDDLLVRGKRRAGWQLGLVALAQMMITEEVLAATLVVSVCAVGVLIAQHRPSPRLLLDRLPALAVAASVLAVGSAWMLQAQFFGPRRVTSRVHDVSAYAADLLGAVVPTANQLVGTDATTGWAGNVSENGSYLGLPLLVALIALGWRYRRLPVVRFAAVLGLIAWILSLGERLHVAGTATALPLPFALMAGLPVLGNLIAVRFSLYVVLCASVVLAVGLDRLHGEGRLRLPVAAAAAGLCLLTLLPAWPYRYTDARIPSYFTSSAVLRIPEGSVVLTYPIPRFPVTAPMTWQAVADMRYRIVGGYLIAARDDGSGTFFAGVTRLEKLFGVAWTGRPLAGPSPSLRLLLRSELRQYDVDTVLVSDDVTGAAEVTRFMTALLGRSPDERRGGMTTWYDLRRTLARG